MINWNITREDAKIITAIVRRALEESPEAVHGAQSLDMDITACHLNGCPLDLKKLLDAPAGDFGHDVFGIQRYIDRGTGRLTNCFDPRCSKSEIAAT